MIYDVDYIREFLKLDSRVVADSQIQFLIDHYTEVIKDKTGASNDIIDSVGFQDAVLAGIACNISMTNKGAIIQPNRVKIGYYEEETASRSETNKDPTWCEIYSDELDSLIEKIQGAYGFYSLTRQGASEKRGFY